MPVRLPTTILRATATVLLIAAGWVFTSGTAAASCGDYLTINGKPHAETMPGLPAKPCHGPNCTAAPAPAETPLTVPVLVPPSAKDLANRDLPDAADAQSGRHSAYLQSEGRPIRRPTESLDPPRPV